MMVEPTERKRDSTEKLVHPQEVSVQDSECDLRRVALVRNSPVSHLITNYV